jgi:cytidylate kinase
VDPRGILSADMVIPAERPTGPVIAIDGPAGAGKSTLAHALATELGLPYVNTGLMYRALADRALERHVDPDDAAGLVALVGTLTFDLRRPGAGVPELTIDGGAPSPALTSPAVEASVSRVARHRDVRELMRARQRELGSAGSVMEGRDIGTVVFPDADLKIFLSAAPVVRVGRRARERDVEADGSLAEALASRDALDARTNPLEPAPDAHVLDTTTLDRSAVLAEALRLARPVVAARS